MQKAASNWYDDYPIVELKGKTSAVCKIGDAISIKTHTTLIVGVNSNNYVVAESTGLDGVVISNMPFNGYRDGNQYYCESLSDKYTN